MCILSRILFLESYWTGHFFGFGLCLEFCSFVLNKIFVGANIDSQLPNTDAIMMSRKRYKATTTQNLQKSHSDLPDSFRKYTTIESQEALGDSFGTTSAPRGPQDRKRDEQLGSLAAPRGAQRSFKILSFVLIPEHKVKKELQ